LIRRFIGDSSLRISGGRIDRGRATGRGRIGPEASATEMPESPHSIGPGPEEPPDDDELAEVVRVVVGHEEGLAQDRLALAVGQGGDQVPGRAAFETDTAAQECYEAAALASAPYGEVLRSSQPRFSLARQLPVGVVGVIAPFNVPIVLAIRAIAPALALGNAVLFKPDPRTAVCGGVTITPSFTTNTFSPHTVTRMLIPTS